MEYDIFYIVKNVLKLESKNETTIAIELKNLIEENDIVYIQLEYGGEIIGKIRIKERIS